MLQLLLALKQDGSNPFYVMMKPVIDLLTDLLTPMLLLVGAIGTIYCVFLGLKYAKADEPQEQQKAKSALKNAIIGFVMIFVLIVVLKVGIDPLANWVNATSGDSKTFVTESKKS